MADEEAPPEEAPEEVQSFTSARTEPLRYVRHSTFKTDVPYNFY